MAASAVRDARSGPADAMIPTTGTPVLEIRDLSVRFRTPEGEVSAVSNVSFEIGEGETLGIVGESGSGKSQTFMAVMGLLATNGYATGQALFRGRDLLKLGRRQLNTIRGAKMSMIFQDPMTSLTPHLKISRQMTEVLVLHKGMSEQDARRRAIDLLDQVRIPDAARRIDMYPHEFSGGMRQRVMIAMSLLCDPEVLIADEPTTALDVTVQAQILDLLSDLRRELNTAIILITHDLGVVAGLCDRVQVMYGGRFCEAGSVDDLFYRAQHPYTRGLVASVPRPDLPPGANLSAIPGQPPNLQSLPSGCAFRERCDFAFERCAAERPVLRPIAGADGRFKSCHLEGFGADGEVLK